jgi:hypothetical protein
MKKYSIVFLVCMQMIGVLGQNQNSENLKLPNVTPPSPEAFAITKYGDTPVNEFSGMVNLSIPIYKYKVGNLELPVSLNYSGDAVRVDEIPTQTGINWTLNAGGVITRMINDLPDEKVALQNRVYLSEQEISNLNTPDGTVGAATLNNILRDINYDSEVDVFNFNFNGYSGSFHLDKNYTPVLTKLDSELIISPLFAENKIMITTPDGVKYIFGGSQAIEMTYSTSQEAFLANDTGITAFFLSEIQHPINGSIFLEYQAAVNPDRILGMSESITIVTYNGFPSSCNINSSNLNSRAQILRMFNQRFIKRIYNNINNDYILFETSAINEKTILDKIKIYKNLNLFNEIKFNYMGLESYATKKRFFLSNVIFNNNIVNTGSIKNEQYTMEYNDALSLPNRLSYAQDYYGYYNGKLTNQVLLPNLPFNNGFEFYSGKADRTPKFEFASKGALTKIKYPTGGYSIFEYEPNPVKDKLIKDYGISVISSSSENNLISQIPGYSDTAEGLIDIAPIYQDQTIDLKLNMSSSDFVVNHAKNVTITVTNLTDNIIVLARTKNLGFSNSSTIYNINLLKGKLYKFELKLNTSEGLNPSMTANIRFSLITGIKLTDGAGIRISRQSDYTNNQSLPIVKKYYYMPLNKVGKPLEEQNIGSMIYPSFFSNSIVDSTAPPSCGGSPFITYYAYKKTFHSNPLYNYYSNNNANLSNPVVVISYGGDNFENGGKQKIFSLKSNTSNEVMQILSPTPTIHDISMLGSVYTSKTSNFTALNGNLIQEIDFTKKDNLFYKLKQTDHFRDNSVFKSTFNIVGSVGYNISTLPQGVSQGSTTSNCYIKWYKYNSYNDNLISSKTIQYIDNARLPSIEISVDKEVISEEIDETGIKKLTTTQSFEYGALRGLPIKITTTTSDSSMSSITQNVYAPQASTLTGLTANQIAANAKMVAQNNIALPIQVEQYKNTTLIDRQRTLYKQWNNNVEQVLPEIIQTLDASQNLEDRVIITEYDKRGNPTMFSYKDGAKVKYLYNANNQVYIKIENFTATLDPNSNPITGDPCVFINQYPNSFVTVYSYDPITNLLIQSMDSSCQKTTYVYDALNRLKQIKDHTGNVIKELDNNYKQ